MTDHLPWLDACLEELADARLVRRRRVVTPLPDGLCRIDGRILHNFASNDYLNLAQDPRVLDAARSALSAAGATASALVCGRTEEHERLEGKLADFERQEAALLFPTGYAANVGVLTALIARDDTIFSDRLNHASLIDGCRLTRARLRVFPHSDLEQLERSLATSPRLGRWWIVTDSVFSMDGDIAPLRELCALAERHGASVIVDEAHATGVFGRCGRGVAEWLDVEDRIAVRVGTLSKAIGAAGGFVAGPQRLIDWLWNRSRTQMFSTALPPATCAAARRALEIIESEPERRRDLLGRAADFRDRLRRAGLSIPSDATGPIVPLFLGAPQLALDVAGQLESRGCFVGTIRPPTVPAGSSRLRITITAAHAADALTELADGLDGVIPLVGRSSDGDATNVVSR